MPGVAIQFRGIEQIMQAYEFNNVPSWAIACGGDIPFQFVTDSLDEGAQALQQCLDVLKKGHSSATYQLRCYIHPPDAIDNKTPFNLSCKFTLWADEESGSITGLHHVREVINDRLDKIEQKLSGDQDDRPQGLAATLGAILQRPEILGAIATRVFGLVDKLLGGAAAVTGRPASMAGVPGPETQDQGFDQVAQLYAQLPEDERIQFDQAIEILLQKDPHIGTHLAKLARILRDQPDKYKLYASML
jgi:hypothetical protein